MEPVHAVVYFDGTVREALREAGLRGFWMGYFAARLAPLGPIGPEVAGALAANFHPAMVARSLPDAWAFCPPEQVLAVRRRSTAAALADRAAEAVTPTDLAQAATLAEAAAARASFTGRALAAANQALPVPDDPWERLWQVCTTLREHRGDGHVAVLVAEGLSGLDAHVLQVAVGAVPRSELQPNRGWNDDEWDRAVARLALRGWVDATGAATDEGRRAKQAIEDRTDRLAAQPWIGDDDGCQRFGRVCAAVAAALADEGVVPYPNAMGVPRP